MVSSLNTYSGGAAEVTSLGLTFLNLDPSGAFMRLSQMQKTYTKFRYIDINHGSYLQAYFQASAIKFDPPTKRDMNAIQNSSSKQYINMIKYRVAFDIFEVNLLRVILYSVSWFFKILSYVLLEIAIRKKNLVKVSCYFIAFSQKAHMITFNVITIDLISYSHRTLFQQTDASFLLRTFSAILLSLLVYDFCEIFNLGGKAIISEFKNSETDENQVN